MHPFFFPDAPSPCEFIHSKNKSLWREYMTQIKMTNTITLSKHNSLNTQMYKHANK